MIRFSDKHPAVTALYFISVTGIAMFVPHPVILLLSLAGALSYYLIRGEASARFLCFTAGLALLMTLINPLLSHRGETVLFFINLRPFTLEALLYGANAALLAAGVIVRMNSFSKIMTTEKVLCLIGRFSPRLSAVISAAVRSVPLFSSYYRHVSSFRALCRGYDSEPTPYDRAKESMEAFSATVGIALEGSIDAADSMDARGWQNGHRTASSRFVFGQNDAAAMIYIALSASVCIAAAASGLLDFDFYPVIADYGRGLFPLTSLVSYAFLSFYPAVSECVWHIMWKKRKTEKYPDAEALREYNRREAEK
ncbi:MAG: energy-coupling factor transporter transmembrane protein EcfT [Clostridia bacterium]|nr:energy-coupling factor transporter transmembrane protein EcfT [Clostridia bacterium]